MMSRRWRRAKVHLAFHANTITQCGRKTDSVLKTMETKEDITCGNCLRWMNSKKGRKLGWRIKRVR
jgi:hypothetical protein